MEQLNYSFFLLVLGDRLLKTAGRRLVHTLAGEAGCSRSEAGRAGSCLVASRHPGNCQSLLNLCRALVTLCCSDTFSCRPTMSHAHAHKTLHSLVDLPAWITSVQVCNHTGTSLKSHLFASTSCSSFPVAYNSLLKLMLLSSLLLPLVSLLPTNSLKLLVWHYLLPLASAEPSLGGEG